MPGDSMLSPFCKFMLKASIKKTDLIFINPGQTSRGTLHTKPSWFLILKQEEKLGIGECSVIPGLNPEFDGDYEKKLADLVQDFNEGKIPDLTEYDKFPSIRFGLETALIDLNIQPTGILFPSEFTEGSKGIPINGLIWMGSKKEMQERISDKLNQGFRVLKLKVGALDFDDEISLLKSIRNKFHPEILEIRLDANGAFDQQTALEKLKRLSEFHIHSIEQPIKAGQWETMEQLCWQSPIPIALDEDLISVTEPEIKIRMLKQIKPQYIILKPSLTGGLQKSREWINIASELNIGWWVTSALESNVGLNAIAQWTYTLNPTMVQGLGTGQVFSNNIPSPLQLKGPVLYYRPEAEWEFDFLN
jgi:o-succinylbenzoate synthase